jgi:chemotaxis protein MotB
MKANREWLSISDMMAGLMMVFLFIAVVFMQKINKDKDAMVDIASAYADTKIKLNRALHKEFDKDLEKWGAEILADNTIRFKEPDVLFARSSSKIREKFKEILNDFFPRYLNILTDKIFKKDIIELRVEGHTSSIWKKESSVQAAYLNNARLSQNRAFSVLDYLFTLSSVAMHEEWLIKVFRANGLAFAKKIIENNVENLGKSRRVEFRVITNTEERIEQILKKAG